MRIAFDHSIFTRQRYGGISRYAVQLILEMHKSGNTVAALAPIHGNAYLHEKAPDFTKGIYAGPTFYKIKGPFILINGVWGTIQALQWQPDILHETYFAPWRQAHSRTPVVITVHDMTHERFPWLFKKSDPSRRLKQRAINRADAIICISGSTRRDLLDLYPEVAHKVSVIPHGFQPLSQSTKEANHALRGMPYILHVGARGGYKNFSTLLKAYALSEKLHGNFLLVAFGGEPFSKQDLETFKRYRITDRVIHVEGDDDVLAGMYRHARAFVFPSLYEGFGFPLLESMSLGCPVICSNSSSFPEVAGDAAVYFSPENTDELKAALERVVFEDSLRRQLIQSGMVRYLQYRWEECARRTMDVYHSITNKI
ncbi:MAG: glycosyltransferase family 4 protein [Saprospiraceae bacterium]|nr:glycosyltransferase family 4 protein [Saprospiraceae bacterium]